MNLTFEFKFEISLRCRGLYEFGEYSFLGVYRNTAGFTNESFNDKGNGMAAVLIILLLEWFIFVPLAWCVPATTCLVMLLALCTLVIGAKLEGTNLWLLYYNE